MRSYSKRDPSQQGYVEVAITGIVTTLMMVMALFLHHQARRQFNAAKVQKESRIQDADLRNAIVTLQAAITAGVKTCPATSPLEWTSENISGISVEWRCYKPGVTTPTRQLQVRAALGTDTNAANVARPVMTTSF